jgi:hypothetical protein
MPILSNLRGIATLFQEKRKRKRKRRKKKEEERELHYVP